MKFTEIKQNKNIPYLVLLLGMFIVSRMLYDKNGIVFFWDTYLYHWNFIPPSLLKTDLWRSIFYLHSQPPLMNILVGIVLQLFPAHIKEIFHVLYYFAGLVLTLSLYFLGVDWGFPRWLSLGLAVMFSISPSTIIYEHWLAYGYLIASALAFSGVALYRFSKTRKTYWGVLFFSSLAFVSLSWTLFHLVWMLVVFVAVFYFFVGSRKKVILAALIPLVIVSGWYAKNLVVFGEFTAGTWGGMNLSNITTFSIPDRNRRQMIKSGELSSFAVYAPFRNPSQYLEFLPNTPVTGIPILDITEFPDGTVNHHHLVYIEASQYYMKDALHVIRMAPAYYLRVVGHSVYIFFHSSSDYKLIWDVRAPIEKMDLWWSRLFYGQWLNYDENTSFVQMSPLYVGWWIVLSFILGVLGNTGRFLKSPKGLFTADGLVALFMLLTVIYLTFIGNFMDIGENNRFRFVIDPFILLLAVRAIHPFIFKRFRIT